MSERPLPDLIETLSRDTRAYLDAELVRVKLEAELRVKHLVRTLVVALVVLMLLGVSLHLFATAAARSLQPWLGGTGAPLLVGGVVLVFAMGGAFVGLRPPAPRASLQAPPARKELSDGNR
ncbi:MAG: phage holin family protein [Myxococcota bacterium]